MVLKKAVLKITINKVQGQQSEQHVFVSKKRCGVLIIIELEIFASKGRKIQERSLGKGVELNAYLQ